MSFYSPFQFKTVNYRSKFVRMSFDLAHIFPHLASADAFCRIFDATNGGRREQQCDPMDSSRNRPNRREELAQQHAVTPSVLRELAA